MTVPRYFFRRLRALWRSDDIHDEMSEEMRFHIELRAEEYESYVDLVPGEWTKMKIEVRGDKARLYVHDASQPVLVVNDLKQGPNQGQIALWVGPGTVAHFANLRVSK